LTGSRDLLCKKEVADDPTVGDTALLISAFSLHQKCIFCSIGRYRLNAWQVDSRSVHESQHGKSLHYQALSGTINVR